MDNGQQVAASALTDREKVKVHDPTDLWTDSFALKVAVQDFQRAETYRTQNCDWRWRRSAQLYHAWVEQKYWQGTKQPRASLGIYLCFEQIESILPKLLQNIFADNPWFDAEPLGPTTPEEAATWKYLILAQLDKQKVREKFRRVIKSALTFGDGILELSWCREEKSRLQWISKFNPRKDPFSGKMNFDRMLDKQTLTRIENYPELEVVPITDFYVDPNCSSPDTEEARYVIKRKLVTVDYLDKFRDSEEFDIPPKVDLIELAKRKTSSQGDQTAQSMKSFRMMTDQPWVDATIDPGGQRLEVLEYKTQDRLVWVANREQVLLNVPNSYGFKGYYHAVYTDDIEQGPGGFYGIGIPDVIGGEQQFKQSLRNARLDELSLAIHRPLIRKLGLKVPEYQRIVKPGQQWEADKPKEDFVFLDVPNITQNAYIEDQFSDVRAQKTTGVTDLAVLGTPSSGGNSANRTATGVGAQVQASASRLQYLVENLESTFVEPLLNDLVTLNKMFPPIGQQMAETIAMSRVELSMRASARMQARMGLLQTFPLIFQAATNPGLISELGMQNKTIDFVELFRVVQDMTGYRTKATLVRDLTPEEQKARNQPPAQEMLRMQMQRERIQGQAQIAQAKMQSDRAENEAQREDDADSENADGMVKLAQSLIQAHSQQEAAKHKSKPNGK